MRFNSALVFAGLVLFSPTMRAQVPHTVPSGSTDRWTAKSGAALSEDCLTVPLSTLNTSHISSARLI